MGWESGTWLYLNHTSSLNHSLRSPGIHRHCLYASSQLDRELVQMLAEDINDAHAVPFYR